MEVVNSRLSLSVLAMRGCTSKLQARKLMSMMLMPFTEVERDITYAYNGAWLEKTDDEPLTGRVSTQAQ